MKELLVECKDEQRRHKVRQKKLNGIDYVEVYDDIEILQKNDPFLLVYFLNKFSDSQVNIQKENVIIEGGRRITDIKVIDLIACKAEDSEQDDCIKVLLNKIGDFSPYQVCLVEVDDKKSPKVHKEKRPFKRYKPLNGLDPRYACQEFHFRSGCPKDLDCKPENACPPKWWTQPELNYLAKDYASFRQLILDRLSLVMPDWKEHHVPDLGMTLVELLAYVGDYLSYKQDAVATEAYLGTARQRISVRRHTRLVDYDMHEGNNARTWVWVNVSGNPDPLDPEGFFFVTRFDERIPEGAILSVDKLPPPESGLYEVFEPLLGTNENDKNITFYESHNEISFYTWGDKQCCLPRGATKATLRDEWADEVDVRSQEQRAENNQQSHKILINKAPSERKRGLNLKIGDVLIFEEKISPTTGKEEDADPSHVHAVRLTGVEKEVDRLNDQPVLEIEWRPEDALPVPLCISAIGDPPDCKYREDISVAHGNVILVDHGRSVKKEELGSVSSTQEEQVCLREGCPSDLITHPKKFRPILKQGPITFRQPIDIDGPASTALAQNPRQAQPVIYLNSQLHSSHSFERWIPKLHLLDSHWDDPHFVAEMDQEGRVHLRFGDGDLGRQPQVGEVFTANYRIGNGPAGNVGAGAIAHLVLKSKMSGVRMEPHNPFPAQGGYPPEPIEEVKLFAPHAYHKKLQRAITDEDYSALVMNQFDTEVQRAAATLRWTGSCYEVLIAIDPKDQILDLDDLIQRVENYLEKYRRVGHDLVVREARYVPLDIEMTVCVRPGYLRGHVKAALLDLFSNRRNPDGGLGFFHPDRLSFGEAIKVSKLVAVARALPGIENVMISKLQRWGELANGEIDAGILPIQSYKVPRLDNDPDFPENGRLVLVMRGGR